MPYFVDSRNALAHRCACNTAQPSDDTQHGNPSFSCNSQHIKHMSVNSIWLAAKTRCNPCCCCLCGLQVEFYYITAANQLQRPFVRCIVVGDSNRSVEAAHELGMKSVIVTGNQPAWNFSGADLVVRNLSQLSFVNMKKLFGNEDLVEAQFELEQQPEQLEHL